MANRKNTNYSIFPYTFTPEMMEKFDLQRISVDDSQDVEKNFFRELYFAWRRYVPETDDCIGNCIMISEREGTIPKGTHAAYLAHIKIYKNNSNDQKWKTLNRLSIVLGINIIVHRCVDLDNKRVRVLNYNKQKERIGVLVLNSLLNCIFLLERTKFTSFSINEGYTTLSEEVIEWIKSKPTNLGQYKISSTVNRDDNGFTHNTGSRFINSINFVKRVIANKDMTCEIFPEDIVVATVIDDSCLNRKFHPSIKIILKRKTLVG